MQNSLNLIQSYYKAFNDKKFSEMLSFLTEDVIHDTNQGLRTTGKAAFTEFMESMDKFYDENLTDIVVMSNTDGSRLSAEFICNGTYKTSAPGLPPAKGQKYKLPVGCFFEVREGKIARVTNYYNLNDWLKQVK